MSELDDFLDDLEEEVPADLEYGETDEHVGDGKLTSQGGHTSRQMVDSVWKVFHQLGGEAWLYQQARAYPKEFLQILKQMLPKDVQDQTPPNFNIAILQADGEQIRGSQDAINITQDDEQSENVQETQQGVLVAYKH